MACTSSAIEGAVINPCRARVRDHGCSGYPLDPQPLQPDIEVSACALESHATLQCAVQSRVRHAAIGAHPPDAVPGGACGPRGSSNSRCAMGMAVSARSMGRRTSRATISRVPRCRRPVLAIDAVRRPACYGTGEGKPLRCFPLQRQLTLETWLSPRTSQVRLERGASTDHLWKMEKLA